MREAIEQRFTANLQRVESLIAAYDVVRGGGRGRPSTQASDVLRAAVVLLHASLEDLVRSLLEWRLPSGPAEALEGIALPGRPAGKRHELKELAEFRGMTVDELIQDAVRAHLQESNYNNVGQIVRALELLGVRSNVIAESDKTRLTAMMKRRHWIVHRLDANSISGSGQHAAQSIAQGEVRGWIDTVRAVGQAIVGVVARD
jgi:hypothetical protein